MITHGMTVKYGSSTYSTRGHETIEDAADKIAEILAERNYTFPKPWQFWRWDEHVPSKVLREALERRGVK